MLEPQLVKIKLTSQDFTSATEDQNKLEKLNNEITSAKNNLRSNLVDEIKKLNIRDSSFENGSPGMSLLRKLFQFKHPIATEVMSYYTEHFIFMIGLDTGEGPAVKTHCNFHP